MDGRGQRGGRVPHVRPETDVRADPPRQDRSSPL
jgi:hypothetical protein